MIDQSMELWHRIVKERDIKGLASFLDPDVTFHSPVLFEPQQGIKLTTFYLAAALQVLGNEHFTYVRELRDPPNAVLEFTTDIDGVIVNGVDMIQFNDKGLAIEFKVMLRPMKGIQIVQQRMFEMLGQMKKG